MILTSDMYVPALRWRLAEYQALLRLATGAKDRIVPYIVIPNIEFDFDDRIPNKSVQQHVHPFVARYKAKWGQRPAWIGVHTDIADKKMDDGRDIFTYVFEGIRAFQANAIPAIPLDTNQAESVGAIIAVDQLGLAIAIRLEDLMKPDTNARIETIISSHDVTVEEVDLLIDLGAANFEPYDAFANALIAAMGQLDSIHAYRNLVLIGTAIPETFRDVAKGADQIPRHDWLFYRTLLDKTPDGMRRPNFGDYTIVHPEFSPVDMRMIKPAGKVVYATPDNWEVRKGGNFRDNPEQMHNHCASIVASGEFRGADFSNGDDYIAKCAIRKEGPSNLTRWKEVGISHHITQALDDLATLGGPS